MPRKRIHSYLRHQVMRHVRHGTRKLGAADPRPAEICVQIRVVMVACQVSWSDQEWSCTSIPAIKIKYGNSNHKPGIGIASQTVINCITKYKISIC